MLFLFSEREKRAMKERNENVEGSRKGNMTFKYFTIVLHLSKRVYFPPVFSTNSTVVTSWENCQVAAWIKTDRHEV